MRKVIIGFLLIIGLFNLSACGRFGKSYQSLLKGDWVQMANPMFEAASGDLLKVSPIEMDFNNEKEFKFNSKEKELTYPNGEKRKISFDRTGNILTVKNVENDKEIRYYRKDSNQYKDEKEILQKQVDSVNEVWEKQYQSYLQQFEKAIEGTWSNAEVNAQVDLKRDSPDPDTKLVISSPKFFIFETSFLGANRRNTMSASFDNQKITDAALKLTDTDLVNLLDESWRNSNHLEETKESLEDMTFRDLFMRLGELTLSYSVPDKQLEQDITVSAYGNTIAPNLSRINSISVISTDLTTQKYFESHLTMEK